MSFGPLAPLDLFGNRDILSFFTSLFGCFSTSTEKVAIQQAAEGISYVGTVTLLSQYKLKVVFQKKVKTVIIHHTYRTVLDLGYTISAKLSMVRS